MKVSLHQLEPPAGRAGKAQHVVAQGTVDGVNSQPAVELLQDLGDQPWNRDGLTDLGGFFLKNVILQWIVRLIYGDGKAITCSLLYGLVVGSIF